MNIKPKTIKLLKEDTEKYPGDFEIIKKKNLLRSCNHKENMGHLHFLKIKVFCFIKRLQTKARNSLVVQWLGVCGSTAGDTGLIPGQGT